MELNGPICFLSFFQVVMKKKSSVVIILCLLVRLLITFANSLDPDQARHNVGPDLDPNCLTL